MLQLKEPTRAHMEPFGCGSKLGHQGDRRFSPWLHLPGFQCGFWVPIFDPQPFLVIARSVVLRSLPLSLSLIFRRAGHAYAWPCCNKQGSFAWKQKHAPWAVRGLDLRSAQRARSRVWDLYLDGTGYLGGRWTCSGILVKQTMDVACCLWRIPACTLDVIGWYLNLSLDGPLAD